MRRVLILVGTLVALAGLLAGCGSKPTTAPNSNMITPTAAAQARMSAIMAATPQVIEDGQFQSSEVATLGTGPAGSFAAISPLHFWRTITHVDRTVTFAFSDTDSTGKPLQAIATVTKVLTGTFNIATAAGDSTHPDSVAIIHKPLEDHWVRRLMFIRVPHPIRTHRDLAGRGAGLASVADGDSSGTDDEDWRLVGTSAVEVTSNDAATHIASVRLQATGLDTTFTDPLALSRLHGFMRFDPGTPLTLTVTTGHSDDVVVLLLHGHRVQFKSNGDDTYTLSLPLPGDEDVDGLRHVGVNALSHGTLFDDSAPYDSQAWILPFMVKPNWMAEDFH